MNNAGVTSHSSQKLKYQLKEIEVCDLVEQLDQLKCLLQAPPHNLKLVHICPVSEHSSNTIRI